MASFKDTAIGYIPKVTLNIADLDKVDLSFPIEERSATDKDGVPYVYKVMVANGLEYRVPNTVIEEVKKILELKPEVRFIKVLKQGTGLNTRYGVKVMD